MGIDVIVSKSMKRYYGMKKGEHDTVTVSLALKDASEKHIKDVVKMLLKDLEE